MKTPRTIKSIIFAVGLALLLSVAASANSADQSIWFQNHSMSQAYDLGSGPTCSFSANAGESIWFQNQVYTQPRHTESMTLCSVTNLPGDSIWFHD
ncbi:MAG: hypothetical protein P8Z73_12515 [Desulfobacteraceae bacterium]